MIYRFKYITHKINLYKINYFYKYLQNIISVKYTRKCAIFKNVLGDHTQEPIY